jgi:uncharacterized protein (DUF305 family)
MRLPNEETSTMRIPLLAAAILLAVSLPAAAQHDHSGHGAGSGAAADYAEANTRMHEAMAIAFSGDVDVDFLRSMIPHHQGAIDMARVVLEHGTDPEVRAMAEAIIAAQEAEIAEMQAMLRRLGQ